MREQRHGVDVNVDADPNGPGPVSPIDSGATAAHDAMGLDGELTLEMLLVGGGAAPWTVETTRCFDRLDRRRLAELLEAVEAAAFFTRPEPVIDEGLSTVLFRVRIRVGERSRELFIGEPGTDPALERLARAARLCLSDRKVLTMATLSREDREAIGAALRAAGRAERGQWLD